MVNKTISIPFELHEKLKHEENASALICKLLIQHYEMHKERTEEELRQELAVAQIELEALKKIEALKQQNEIPN